jgi:hypothetical protein
LDQLDLQLGGQPRQPLVDLGQGGGAVDVRLAAAEQVQVGAVQDEDLHGSTGCGGGGGGVHLRMRASSSL